MNHALIHKHVDRGLQTLYGKVQVVKLYFKNILSACIVNSDTGRSYQNQREKHFRVIAMTVLSLKT